MTFQSQLSDSVVDRGMDSGIEASDGLRVDDGKLRAQSILVKKTGMFHCKTRVPISSSSRKRQRVLIDKYLNRNLTFFYFLFFI